MVEKTITLQSENTLDIRLASGPGGFITVNILCSANCPGVEITSPDDGSTINRSKAMVRGSLYNVSGETGASVTNDGASFMLEVHGAGFAGKVPLHVGVNTITATATDACGLKAKDTITISADSIEEPVRLTAVPSSGIPSVSTGAFTVTFEADAYVPNPVANYSWDFNGDGIVDESGSGLSEVTTGYEQTGLYFPSVTVTDTLGNAYTETTVVNVLSRDEMDNLLKGRWEGMREGLVNGDIDRALKFFHEGSKEKYGTIFQLVGSELPNIATNMREIQLVYIHEDVAKYATPEMTWETYKEAILNGDIDAALDCFVEYAKDFQRKRLYDRVIGIKGMKKRIDPVKKIELVRSGIADQHGLYAPTEYKEYRIVTEKGPADWFVLFVKVNGEWKIESLPF